MFALLITGLLCHGTAAIAAVEYKIVTASERGTYIKIGRDLASLLLPQQASTWTRSPRPDQQRMFDGCVTSQA